jgi:cell shape-determining protein MreD
MKAGLLYPVLVALIAILLDPFTRMNLVLVASMVVAWHAGPQTSFGAGVVLGWLTDLRQMRLVGITSLFYLILCMVIQMVRWQFGSSNLVLVAVFAVVISSVSQLLFSVLALEVVIWELGLTMVLWWGYALFRATEGVYLR